MGRVFIRVIVMVPDHIRSRDVAQRFGRQLQTKLTGNFRPTQFTHFLEGNHRHPGHLADTPPGVAQAIGL